MKDFAKSIRTGNAKFRIYADLGIIGTYNIIDGWEADSEEEAVKEFIKLNPKYANGKKGYIKAEKTGNSKVGNSRKEELQKELEDEKNLLKSLKKQGGERGYGITSIMYEEAKKKIKKIEEELNRMETGNSKVGNSWDSVYKTIYAVKSYADNAEDIFNGGNPNLDAVKRSLQQAISYAQKAISEVDAYKKESK